MTISSMENNAQELVLERMNDIMKRFQKLNHNASLQDVDLVPLAQSGALDVEIIGKWKPMSLHHLDLKLFEFSPEQRDRLKKLLKKETCNKGYYVIEYKINNGRFLTSRDKSKNETCTELYRKSTRTWITEFSLTNGKKQRIARTLKKKLLEIVLEDENGVKMQLLFKRIKDDVSDDEREIMAVNRMSNEKEAVLLVSGAMVMLFFVLIMPILLSSYS